MYKKYIKRILDFILSLVSIILLSPVLLIIWFLVRIKLGKPAIFKQQRPGLNENIFTLYKFRTMTDERDQNGNLLPDDKRLTKFGKILRSTSLDELPELINIIKGDMSIVGPRPQLIRDMVFFDMEQIRRQAVRPGLTGLAQVNGRNMISWQEKLEYDLEYLNNINFYYDLKIIFKTISKVFEREGITSEECETSFDYGDYLLVNKKITQNEYNKKMKKASEIEEKVGENK